MRQLTDSQHKYLLLKLWSWDETTDLYQPSDAPGWYTPKAAWNIQHFTDVDDENKRHGLHDIY